MLINLENTATVWVFQSDKKINDNDLTLIKGELGVFVSQWNTHGEALTAGFEIKDDYFVIIGVDEEKVKASGCSKDTMTRKMNEIGDVLKIDFFNRLNTIYINNNGERELVSMFKFKELVNDAVIKPNTIVYNNLIQTKEELSTQWKIMVKDSWHSSLVPIQ